VIRRNTDRGRLSGDHPGRVAGTATVLLTATDEILGTHSDRSCRACRKRTFGPWRLPPVCPIVEAEMIKMPVLVVYASKHGATRGIAGRIAARLASDPLEDSHGCPEMSSAMENTWASRR